MKVSNLLGLMCLFSSGVCYASQTTKGLNHSSPKGILTPDKVETRIGTLNYSDGVPTRETSKLLQENLVLMRAVDTFLNGMPAASLEALRRGMLSLGLENYNDVVLFENLMDSNSLFLTGNTDTVYAIGSLDLKKHGPIVVEVPEGSGPGMVNDSFFRYVINMGPPGPDAGKGGKYLILPPGYKKSIPKGYHVARSKSWYNSLILRGYLVDGKPDSAVKYRLS